MSFRYADADGVHYRGLCDAHFVDRRRASSVEILHALFGSVCGHDVVCAHGGGEALAHFETGEVVDLVFCDLTMPDIDGVEVHRAICDNHPEWRGRFVFLTGGVSDETIDSYIQNSGAQVLSKPVRQVAFDKILADISGV